jgi:hypothetical protein
VLCFCRFLICGLRGGGGGGPMWWKCESFQRIREDECKEVTSLRESIQLVRKNVRLQCLARFQSQLQCGVKIHTNAWNSEFRFHSTIVLVVR